MMDFKQIEAFVNVVRCKSFSKAAEAMFFSQPTISAHVAVLEKELGCRLLDRKGRSVELTREGALFFEHAVELVNIRARAIREINDNRVEYGMLEIKTSSIPALIFLPDILSRFRQRNEKIRFHIDSSDTQTVISDIIGRIGEIGFVGERTNDAKLRFEEVFTDRMALVVPAGFDIPDEVSLEEVLNYPFIWRESGSATRKLFEAEAAKKGFDRKDFEVVANFNDIDPLIRSVEEGLGVSLLSEHLIERLTTDKLRAVKITDISLDRVFYMITAMNASLSPAAAQFRKFVLDRRKTGSE